MTSDRSLEARIRAIEDRLEIYNVIASHPPSADTGGSEHIGASWVEDGVFDRGEPATRGRAAIAGQVLSPGHQAAIAGGLAHFTGLPHDGKPLGAGAHAAGLEDQAAIAAPARRLGAGARDPAAGNREAVSGCCD